MPTVGIRSATQLKRGAEASRLTGSDASASAPTESISPPKRGVPIFNAPFSNTRSVAELDWRRSSS
jgi:hypothetical protein